MVNEATVIRAFEGCEDYSSKKKTSVWPTRLLMFQEVSYQYFLHITWSQCREHAGLELQMKPLLKKIQTSFGMSECPIRVVSIFPSGVGRDQLMNRLLWQHRASLSIDNLGSSGETLGC